MSTRSQTKRVMLRTLVSSHGSGIHRRIVDGKVYASWRMATFPWLIADVYFSLTPELLKEMDYAT